MAEQTPSMDELYRQLPPELQQEVRDFARYLLDTKIRRKQSDEQLDEQETETEEDIGASEERWDRLLARPEAKRKLRDMAREAHEDDQAGRTTDITPTEDGRLAPP